MENFIQILILSITQGITEFLPVSSSAHLNLLSKYFGIQNELLINVYAHMGSLLAVIFFFKEDIFNFGKNKKLFYKIILASIPLFGFGSVFAKKEFLILSPLGGNIFDSLPSKRLSCVFESLTVALDAIYFGPVSFNP